MKNLLFTAGLLAALALTSCGGPSGASGEQVDKAYEDWNEMKENLQQPAGQAKATTVATPDTAANAVIAPADTAKQR